MGDDERLNKSQLPLSEVQFQYSRSSGPGGQHVNKTNSNVELRWNVLESTFFNSQQKDLLIKNLKSVLTKDFELLVTCSTQRSREQNINEALLKFQALIKKGLFVPKKRKKTHIPYSQKMKRLEGKKLQKQKKQNRKDWD